MNKDYVLVLVTTPSKSEAEKITQHLLDKKLIACGNIIGPVHSLFRWSGNIERAEEYLTLMKTRRQLFGLIEEEIKTLHSYEIPEILAVRVLDGSKTYLEWLESCLT